MSTNKIHMSHESNFSRKTGSFVTEEASTNCSSYSSGVVAQLAEAIDDEYVVVSPKRIKSESEILRLEHKRFPEEKTTDVETEPPLCNANVVNANSREPSVIDERNCPLIKIYENEEDGSFDDSSCSIEVLYSDEDVRGSPPDISGIETDSGRNSGRENSLYDQYSLTPPQKTAAVTPPQPKTDILKVHSDTNTSPDQEKRERQKPSTSTERPCLSPERLQHRPPSEQHSGDCEVDLTGQQSDEEDSESADRQEVYRDLTEEQKRQLYNGTQVAYTQGYEDGIQAIRTSIADTGVRVISERQYMALAAEREKQRQTLKSQEEKWLKERDRFLTEIHSVRVQNNTLRYQLEHRQHTYDNNGTRLMIVPESSYNQVYLARQTNERAMAACVGLERQINQLKMVVHAKHNYIMQLQERVCELESILLESEETEESNHPDRSPGPRQPVSLRPQYLYADTTPEQWMNDDSLTILPEETQQYVVIKHFNIDDPVIEPGQHQDHVNSDESCDDLELPTEL